MLFFAHFFALRHSNQIYLAPHSFVISQYYNKTIPVCQLLPFASLKHLLNVTNGISLIPSGIVITQLSQDYLLYLAKLICLIAVNIFPHDRLPNAHLHIVAVCGSWEFPFSHKPPSEFLRFGFALSEFCLFTRLNSHWFDTEFSTAFTFLLQLCLMFFDIFPFMKYVYFLSSAEILRGFISINRPLAGFTCTVSSQVLVACYATL